MTLLYWQAGKRINDFILEHKRAEYGRLIVITLSRQLEERFNQNFGEKNFTENALLMRNGTFAYNINTLVE
ncbi:DUF1016 N-terminal domain-containing protein [Cognataquiflexum nitidum]|uniref:DUF1016 N-terminal domain-containing protein n=1 Tax=Cognataquiflexum nitidum TaxID=2922272 RepID=UPI003AB92161